MYMRDILLDVIRPVDSSAIPPSAATARKSSSQGQKDVSADTGTAGVGVLESQYRARIYAYERLIEQLYDLMPERCDDAYDLVRAEYRAIHGPRD